MPELLKSEGPGHKGPQTKTEQQKTRLLNGFLGKMEKVRGIEQSLSLNFLSTYKLFIFNMNSYEFGHNRMAANNHKRTWIGSFLKRIRSVYFSARSWHEILCLSVFFFLNKEKREDWQCFWKYL